MIKRDVCFRVVLAGLAVLVSVSAGAQSRVTVRELETVLTADHAAHRSDSQEVVKLATYAPSERIVDPRLAKLKALSPGPYTSSLLRLLAEASLFLPPPSEDVPTTAAPSFADQKQMLGRTVDYVKNAIPKLPDFLATRNNREFNDTPAPLGAGEWAVKGGLRLVHIDVHQIGYRNGAESDDPAVLLASVDPKTQKSVHGDENTWNAFRQLQEKRAKRPATNGLNTWGEFGPILQQVLVDAALSNQIKWTRWEQRPSGQVAVFSYHTSAEKSHYPINYCCVYSSDGSHGLIPFRRVVPYQGEITIDPVSGTILRVTLDAETKPEDPVMRAAILVDYAPVKIEEGTYYCPTRSISLSLAQPDPIRSVKRPARLSLNEAYFSNYHKFTSTVKLLTDAEATAEIGKAPGEMASSVPPSTDELVVLGKGAQPENSEAPAAEEPVKMSETADAAGKAAPPEAAVAAALPVIPEIRQSIAPAFPDFHVAEDPSVLRASSRLVDVGIGIYDKHGHALRDIKPEELQILDNGRPQKIAFFAVPEAPQPAAPVTGAKTLENPNHFDNRSQREAELPVSGPGQSASGQVAAEAATTVLLMDEENLAWPDLSRSKQEMLAFLKKLPPGERVAFYAMDQFGFHVLTEVTSDHAMLITRLQKWAPNIQSVSHAEEAEARNRQQIDWVRSTTDLSFVNGNRDDLGGDTLPDPQLRDFGAAPGREAMRVLIAVARHLAAVPGHKALVWVTSDNALADWQDQEVGTEKHSTDVKALVLMAANLMNDAHVSVYPFDASQLEGGGIDASLENRNVEVNPGALPAIGNQPRNQTPGRAIAQMHADLHPIQGTFRDLAQDTGGRAIRRTNDMEGNLNSVFEDGHATYLVSFVPDTAPDNKYHKIAVEVQGRKGLVIHSRTGYMFSGENTDPRSRFQAVAWQPEDSPEIGLSADAGPSPQDGAGVCRLRLKVRLRDLVLNQKDDRAQDKVDIYLLQRDEYNGQAHSSGETLNLALKPETLQAMQQTGFSYERAFKLDPRTGSVRMIVVDENSGKIASLTISRNALLP